MQKENNTTLVLVTHDDELAEKCQTHYRIDAGQITSFVKTNNEINEQESSNS